MSCLTLHASMKAGPGPPPPPPVLKDVEPFLLKGAYESNSFKMVLLLIAQILAEWEYGSFH